MSLFNSLKPKFWDYRDVAAGPHASFFSFRRMWKRAAFLTAGVAIVPLILLTAIDYHVTQKSIESENLLRTSRLVSNTRRSIFYFFEERKGALKFIAEENSFGSLCNPANLEEILKNLKNSFGGFTDLGIIDPLGIQRCYVGPYELTGKDYSHQEWYREVLARGTYISDAFYGFRNEPHLVIALKRVLPNGIFFVLRATLDTKKFNDLLSGIEMEGQADAFIVNREGILQTPSLYHGKLLRKMAMAVPQYAPRTRVFETENPKEGRFVIGYKYITETPFILMVVQHKTELMRPWQKTRMQLIVFLFLSVVIILAVVVGTATYLVNRIYLADQRRITMLHQVEYANKMASVGRLAAGVAHEINNPLAIINEKAGLIKDLITFRKEYEGDEKLQGLVDSILSSVDRAGAITKRLLGFSRQTEVSIRPLQVKEVIEEVLGFLVKEAEYRSIAISIEAVDEIPQIESDRGKLQEIFLNLINNAFAALNDGGNLTIGFAPAGSNKITISITDDGCGISPADLKKIFEPFFSTKTQSGGTGLGLSITYKLVQEIGGTIEVKSRPGEGTTFTIVLPIKMPKEVRDACEYY